MAETIGLIVLSAVGLESVVAATTIVFGGVSVSLGALAVGTTPLLSECMPLSKLIERKLQE